MSLLKCYNCLSDLKYDFENKEIKCTFCGNICDFENEKVDQTIKPQKILLFEIGLEEIKEKVSEYFVNSAFEYKDCIANKLQPIYIPYWMYDCNCEVEYEEEEDSYKNKQFYLTTAKIECKEILADASAEVEDMLTDQLDRFFDLSKLTEFNDSYIENICVKEFNTTLECVYPRLNEKLKNEVIEDELELSSLAISQKIVISEEQAILVQLPFYYAEIEGLKILINGQTGDIAINSKEYLKTEKRLSFERVLYSDKIQNNLGIISVLGAIFVFSVVIMIVLISDKVKDKYPNLGSLIVFSILAVLAIGVSLHKAKHSVRKQRYIKNILYYNKKKLHIWDKISRDKAK